MNGLSLTCVGCNCSFAFRMDNYTESNKDMQCPFCRGKRFMIYMGEM